MRTKYPQAERQEIQRLIDEAYRRELDAELRKLAEYVDAWKVGNISCFELSDLIHKFHDGTARELFKFYNYAPDPLLVFIYGVRREILKEEEIPERFRNTVKREVEIIRRRQLAEETLQEPPR